MATEHRTLLCFRAAARNLALPLGDIKRVLAVPLLMPPIGAPGFVEGFFDFQGRPVASVRLDRLFGLQEERLGLYAPLLLLADEDQLVALHVNKVDSIVKTAASRIQPIGNEQTFNACVVGRVTHRGETVYLVSKMELLLAAERETLAAHAVMKQRRLDALKSDAVHAA
jgi:chemotaxis signal transduction protein